VKHTHIVVTCPGEDCRMQVETLYDSDRIRTEPAYAEETGKRVFRLCVNCQAAAKKVAA
jgi:hypothetical protein